MLILISIAAFIATILGGLIALRFQDRLHLILGFSAGAIIAVAFFDLIPEAMELAGREPASIMLFVAIGFIAYLVLDRVFMFHSHTHTETPGDTHRHTRGGIGAGSLSVHSVLDGVAIGLAFQVSAAVGAIVAVAVLVHDFSDGMNTVNMVLKNGGDKKRAVRWLLIDSLAPVLGIISTLFFTLPEGVLGIILAVFAGFFLYIGASDLLPESHHAHPTRWTTVMTILGMAVMFAAITIAGV